MPFAMGQRRHGDVHREAEVKVDGGRVIFPAHVHIVCIHIIMPHVLKIMA